VKLKIGNRIKNNELRMRLPGVPNFTVAHYMVTNIRDGYCSQYLKPEDRPLYELTLCTINGKLFKTTHGINCKSIDTDIDAGRITIVA
jgi:hypothetical protein